MNLHHMIHLNKTGKTRTRRRFILATTLDGKLRIFLRRVEIFDGRRWMINRILEDEDSGHTLK